MVLIWIRDMTNISVIAEQRAEADGYAARLAEIVQRQESTHRLRSSKRNATEMAR